MPKLAFRPDWVIIQLVLDVRMSLIALYGVNFSVFSDTRAEGQHQTEPFVAQEEIDLLVKTGKFSCYVETSAHTSNGIELLFTSVVSSIETS